MLLAIDIGNTNIVFGAKKNDHWVSIWRLETSNQKSVQDYAVWLQSHFLEEGIKVSEFRKAIISSVVPGLTHILLETIKDAFGIETVVVNKETYPTLPIKIMNPDEMGTDLVANAVAAYQFFKDNTIIVDFGTALTFTAIASDGTILGVSIAPGLKTAMYSLYTKTAQLPEVPLEMPKSILGKNTIEALQAGVLKGYEGLIRFMVNQIEQEIGKTCKKIATGGLVNVMADLGVSLFDEVNQNLTLDGLTAIASI